MKTNNKSTLFLLLTSIYEIQKEIFNSKLKYSTDSNYINMYLIKQISNEISPILLHLFNRAFYEGIFPDILKIAKIIPVYIKCNRLKPKNYRPISLLPQFSKNFERLIKNVFLDIFF